MDFGNPGFTSNPYLQQSVGDALGDTVRAYNLTTQPAFNSAMAHSGSFGNSGIEQMNQEAQRQLQTSLGRQANDMRSGNFWNGLNFDANNYWQNQNFDRGVYNDTFNQQQQQFQNQLGLLGMMQGANTQNLGMATQIQNTPLNYMQTFGNMANSIGQGYGNSASTMSAQGSPLMGALGGMQLGSAFSKNMGWGGGSGGGSGSWGTGWGSAMGQSGVNGADQIYG